MQGKKYDAATKEKALALLAVSTSIQEVADKLNIPFSTLKTWKDNAEKENDEFVKLRNKKKKEFVNNSWNIIGRAQELLKRRIDRALDNEDQLDQLVNEITQLEGEDLSQDQRKALYKKMSVIKIDDVSKVATVLGTLYDKQALANNERTANIGVESLETLIKKVEGDSAY